MGIIHLRARMGDNEQMNALGRSHFISVSIGWSRGDAIVSKLIRRLEKSYFNHVYYRFYLNNGMSLIYEAHLKGGVQITPYEHLLAAKVKGKVLDIEEVDLDLSIDECQLLWNECLTLHGDPYDNRQILLYYAWIRLLHKKKNTKLFKLDRPDKFTCNQLTYTAGGKIIPKFSKADNTYTPEYQFKIFHDDKSSVEWNRLKHSEATQRTV